MTNKAGHTGLPWDYYNAVQGEDDIAIIHRKGEPDDTMVCKITDEGGPKTSPEANAQFIVTAANYHHRLVELLDKALGCMLVGIDSFSIEDSEVYSEGSALVNKLLDTKKD